MKGFRSFRSFSFGAAALLLLLSACSGKKVNENDPADLYRAAEEDIKGERYLQALDRLRVLQNKFPYSSHSVAATLRRADVYWAQESYAEAAPAYESFCELHPKHEKTPYARLRAAQSYDEDTPQNVARDLTAARKAISAYERFLSQHGSHSDAPKARERIQSLREKLAEKELYIGRFYRRWDVPESARERLLNLKQDYPGTSAAEKADRELAKLPPPEEKEKP